MYLDKGKTEWDSQLVAAVNAYFYLTGVSVPDQRYEEFLDISGARFGEPDIEVIWRLLGIEIDEKKEIESMHDLAIWKYYEGLLESGKSFGLTKLTLGMVKTFNMAPEHRYMTGEVLMKFLHLNQDGTEPRWNVRSYKLL